MKLIIHIPVTFQNPTLIQDYLSQLGLSSRNFGGDSFSCEVIGDVDHLKQLTQYLKQFEKDSVFVIGNMDLENGSRVPMTPFFVWGCRGQIGGDQNEATRGHVPSRLSGAQATSPFFTPTELASIYGLTTNPTDRVHIAIIELGGGYKMSDLNTYWNYLGLKTRPNVYSVAVDGVGNVPGSEDDAEVVLDIEVIGGICPNSNIYVYFAPNTDQGFYDAIHSAIYNTVQRVTVISISWGGPENTWDPTAIQAFNLLFKEAADRGITICVASGDAGSSDGESGGNHVDFPSSSPWVLSCGGTRLTCPTLHYSDQQTKEVVWGTVKGNGATGSGFSSVFNRPTYQKPVTTTYKQTGRGVPDVCGDADPETGWIIYLNGQYGVIGGTSAVAPLWASYLASIGSNQFINPILYSLYQQNNKIVHDITVGNEGSFSAKKGWDPASGLGSANGNLLTSLIKHK
jgi:kumamolisin